MARPRKNIIDLYKIICRKYRAFSIIEGRLLCMSCDKVMPNDAKHITDRVKSHIESKSHKESDRKRQENGVVQLPLSNYIELANRADKELKKFHTDLTRAFVASNIPLYKLQLDPMVEFFGKYISKYRLPSINSLRYSEVDKIYHETVDKIRKKNWRARHIHDDR